MAKFIKYTGTQRDWSELAVTGKQSTWQPGHAEERSDSEAALLIATGLFSGVPVALRFDPVLQKYYDPKGTDVTSLVSGAGNLTILSPGGLAVGATLTAQLGTGWTAAGYQWTRGGADIAGATSSTYVLTNSDTGTSIGCRATGATYTAAVTTPGVAVPAGQLYLDAQPIFIDGANLALV